MLTVDICIATHNMAGVVMDTLISIMDQDYPHKRIIVYDDCSTDNSETLLRSLSWIKYVRGSENLGVGNAFNRAIEEGKSEIVILMCADDLFTDRFVISDIVRHFNADRTIAHVTRWYYQFVHGKESFPVRAWRGNDPLVLANNPSGLAFRRPYLSSCQCSNRMFIETSQLVSQVLAKGLKHRILKYDAVAVRVHGSTSRKPGYWGRRMVSSPVMDWNSIGCNAMLSDFCSLIQIKNNYTIQSVWREICNFVKLRPLNLLHPALWFFALIAMTFPRSVLMKLPEYYRMTIGRWTTREIKRP
jgi:glycosyltransferase involved in cell wall biosynthesis